MRLFVAVNFSAPMLKALTEAQKQLKMQARSGDYVRPANFHLTLAFIGEMENSFTVKGILERIQAAPFPIALAGADHFDDIYFVSLAQQGRLNELAGRIREDLKQAGLPCDDKPFIPHITLGRRIDETSRIVLPVPFVGMMVDRFFLMKSERIEGNLVYTEIGRFMLTDKGDKL